MGRLLDELKRRNVFRAAAAYAIAAWIVLQVAAVTFPPLGVPTWVMTGLTVLAIAGFPITVIISWIYDWTPEGLMTAAAADAAGYVKPAAFGRQIDFVVITLLVIAVGWLAYDRQAGPEVSKNSIAVLPFVNMSADPEQKYFSDGVAEEILNVLAQVPGLKVTARTSSFQFKGQNLDVPLIGEMLNVAAVLEGSVRKSGDTVRITAQLISTADGFHLWSRTYDRRLDDIFAVQDEIAASIVEEMKVHLNLAPDSAVPAARIATATEGYELYLQGLYQLNTMFAPGQSDTKMDAPDIAFEYFRQATEIAPDFAPAWAGKAKALYFMRLMGKVPEEEAQAEIDADINKALLLGPNLADVQFTAGWLDGGNEALLMDAPDRSRLENALAYFDRAIEINPNHAAAHAARSELLQRFHRYRDSFEAAETAFRVDPLSHWTSERAFYLSFYQGKTEGLEERLQALTKTAPDAGGLVMEAFTRFQLSQFDRFPALQRRADAMPGFGFDPGSWIASAPRHFGDTYLTLGLEDMAHYWLMGRYDDAIFISEGRYGEAIEFLKVEFETGKNKVIFFYRLQADITASLVEAYLYAGRYEELTAFLDATSWQPGLSPLPLYNVTNPPWPEAAYTFALFRTGRTDQAQEWLDHMSAALEDRLAQGIDLPNHYYELARIRAMQGRIPEAFAAMERAIEKGWRRWYFDLDPILEPGRALPEFTALKARYDADIARMRDIVAAGLAADTPAPAQ